MQQLREMLNDGNRNITFLSEICPEHAKPVQKMIIMGKVVCPRCESERVTKKLEQETTEWFNRIQVEAKFNTLAEKSIIADQTVLKARFDTYKPTIEEERANAAKVWECVKRYKTGEKFNIILQGNPGSGKSHLSYSALYELNQTKEHSCLFVDVNSMLRKIKGSFSNKESIYTEDYFIRLLSDVDFLVLDDLGAESGAINTDKQATDFVQRVLYGVTNSRQNKATILTTNLDGIKLKSMYDSKLVSRLMRNPEFVIFKESKDKRLSKLPF